MAFGNPYGFAQPTYQTYFPQQQDQMQYRPQQFAPQMSAMQPQQMPQTQPPTQGAPIWVQGEAGAKSFLVAPGQSLILMDSEAEVFYIKATDQSGVPLPLRIFDYKERVTGAQRPVQAAQAPTVDYVTRAEFNDFVAKIAQMTAAPAQQEHPQRMRRAKEVEGEIDA